MSYIEGTITDGCATLQISKQSMHMGVAHPRKVYMYNFVLCNKSMNLGALCIDP